MNHSVADLVYVIFSVADHVDVDDDDIDVDVDADVHIAYSVDFDIDVAEHLYHFYQ